MKSLREMLIQHEGLRLKPYRDSLGKLTIGVGRNLDDIGVSRQEAMILLDSDIMRAKKEAFCFSWYLELDDLRKDVIVNMIFNMGIGKFKTFKKMISAIEKKDYELASAEMLDSLWKIQVGNRAVELAQMMREGKKDGR